MRSEKSVNERQNGKLNFKLLKHNKQYSNYDWMNIDFGNTRIGKVRGAIMGNSLIIYSIMIFPEFERRGYARETIEMFKSNFVTIIADRVRPTAIGFWVKMGFDTENNGNYVWKSGE